MPHSRNSGVARRPRVKQNPASPSEARTERGRCPRENLHGNRSPPPLPRHPHLTSGQRRVCRVPMGVSQSAPRRATARAAPRARIRLPCGPAVRSAAGGLQPRPLPCPSCDGDAMWSLARRSFLALAVSLSWDVGSRRQTALTMRKAIRPPRGPRPPRGRGWLRGGPAAHSCAVSHPRGHPGSGVCGQRTAPRAPRRAGSAPGPPEERASGPRLRTVDTRSLAVTET